MENRLTTLWGRGLEVEGLSKKEKVLIAVDKWTTVW